MIDDARRRGEPPFPQPPGGSGCGEKFGLAVEILRQLHAAPLPLVEADLAHALDTRDWVVSLDPAAGEVVQLAALFHDVERLFSEAEQRVEQHAADYQAFKDAHAQRGAQIACQLLAQAGYDADIRHRVGGLIARHERPATPGDDPELDLLRDADALSFLSLNLPGFLAYYGVEHTRRKLAWTRARLSPAGRRRVADLRLPPDLLQLLDELD